MTDGWRRPSRFGPFAPERFHHRASRAASLFCAAVAGALLIGSLARASTEPTTGKPGAIRVLFIGNSYTRYNQLPRIFRKIAESSRDSERGATNATPPMEASGVSAHSTAGTESTDHTRARRAGEAADPVFIRYVTHSGYTLRMHWRRREAIREIKSGRYTHVVLQGHSLRALTRPGELEEYIKRFASVIESVGAQPILYETWPRRPGSRFYRESPHVQSADAMMERISRAYTRIGSTVGAKVAPVGAAWMEAHRAAPEIDLHRADGSHPTMEGTYLAACVLYATITGSPLDEVSYVPWGMQKEQASSLKEVAARISLRPRPSLAQTLDR